LVANGVACFVADGTPRAMLRSAPELQFHYDDSFDRGARIDAILRDIPEGREGPDEG